MKHLIAVGRAATSASNLHRRVRCPGSHAAESGLPETNSEFADEGTRLHAALEVIGTQSMDLEPKEQDLVISTRRLTEDAIAQAVATFSISAEEPFEEGYERELTLRKGIRLIMPGHCDFWRYYPGLKLLIITDAKFGFIEVTAAPTNLQLRCYAAMGSQSWDVENAVVAIAQPRAYMIEGAEPLSIAQYSRADLALAVSQILEWEKVWLASDAPRIASTDACRYCRAKLLCDAFAARLGPLRGDVAAGIADLTEEQFSALWQAMKLASEKTLQDAIRNEARLRVIEGKMPGYKLKLNHARRSITDGISAAKVLREQWLTESELASVSSITIGELEQLVRRKANVTEKVAKANVNALLGAFMESKTPEPSVVDDKLCNSPKEKAL